jgi:hypothetical protein
MILGFARRPKDITAVVLALQGHGIQVSGPYRTRQGTLIYSLADCIVTESELLNLAKAGKLDPAGVSELIARIMKSGP